MIFSSIIEKLKSDADLVSTIHDEQFIQPLSETNIYTKTILITFILICTTHYTFLTIFRKYKQKLLLNNESEIMKQAYIATNMIVNLTLGIYGLHTILYDPPQPSGSSWGLIFPSYQPDIIQRITGYSQYSHFAAYQLGYNLWSLPVGVLYVNENKLMILHHMAVLTACSFTCYTNLRYSLFTTYIYGCAELSSVPLAIFNTLKDRREWTKKNFKTGFLVVKIIFAVSFLVLRVYFATAMIMDLLRSSALVFFTSFGAAEFDKVLICGFNLFFMCSLGSLQYYWAYLILSGIASMFIPKKKKKAE